MENKHKTCIQRVQGSYNDRMHDLRILRELDNLEYESGDYETILNMLRDEYGRLEEYGLCFDFVSLGTFDDQEKAYWRYQISWGGPSEEFRLYGDGCVEFWFLDWGDGAKVNLNDDDAEFIKNLLSFDSLTWEVEE